MNAKANNTIDKVRELQRKLYRCAKTNRKRKFHALYDKVYRKDVLINAWKKVKDNKGAGGVDEVTIETVKEYGEEKFILEIQDELINGNYHPLPVKRVYIPKKDGSKRPLGIPIVKDRVVQMATKIVIEPIFEANFKDASYGFRPKRNAHMALEEICEQCNHGGYFVLDADIKAYFDNINHDKLMRLVEMNINDRRILKLIRKWLKSGSKTNGALEETNIGAPQGGVISPLLSNIYLNYLDTVWEKYYTHLGKLIRYADDFVIISKNKKNINHAYKVIQEIMGRLEITMHPSKTKIVELTDMKQSFVFLGFEHRKKMMETRIGIKIPRIVQTPSRKAMQSMRDKIKAILSNRNTLSNSLAYIIKTLNRRLQGFKNYYRLRYPSPKLRQIDWYVLNRITSWYNNKKQIRPRLRGIQEINRLIEQLRIVRLERASCMP